MIRWLSGGRARVALEVQEQYGPVVDFTVVKTSGGWRIDDSDRVPVGD